MAISAPDQVLTKRAEQIQDPRIASLERQSIFSSPQKLGLMFCLLLFLATVALYNGATRAPFLNYDDPAYVVNNPHVRAGLTWDTVAWAFRTTELSDWKPITWLSHALDCQIFGANPAGPHTVNVLLHAANAGLLFWILWSATGTRWRSLMVATLFALHPINVESVAWVAERKNVLSMLFFLVALAAYGWYARRPSFGRYLCVTVAFAFSLMAKAQGITFPFVLLLLDYWPLSRVRSSGAVSSQGAGIESEGPIQWKLIWEKLPWFAMSAASAIITARVESDAVQLKLPLWARLGNAAISYCKYLQNAVWPVRLSPIYPHPGLAVSLPAAGVAAVVIIVITILAAIFVRRYRFLVGWFWFLGTLVPMIGLIQIGLHGMADRYAYIPLIGIFVVVCWGSAEIASRWRIPATVPAIAFAAIVIVLGMMVHRQVSYWKDNVTLWTHAVEVTDRNSTAEDNLAGALIAEGRIEEARPHLERALSYQPDDVLAALNLATMDQMHGNYRDAIERYGLVCQYTDEPNLVAMARINRGFSYYLLKQYDDARRELEAALKVQPENAAIYRGFGLLALKSGDAALAVKDYQRSVELQPTSVDFLLLAHALEIDGQREAARAAQAQAARMRPDLKDDMATVRQLLAN
jgi:protein O-mannosyl-transferase